MKAKTYEEYFLSKITRQENEIDSLNNEIKRLTEIIKNYEYMASSEEHEPTGEKKTTIINQSGKYYILDVSNRYLFNDVLSQNGKDPKWLKEALRDNQRLEEVINLEYVCMWNEKRLVGQIITCGYDIFIERDGKIFLIDFKQGTYGAMYVVNDDYCFLDEEYAEKELRICIYRKIEGYFMDELDKRFMETDK